MTKQGQYAFVNQVYADTNMYVPMLSSDLRNQSSIGTDGKSITWHSIYARRQYHNIGAKFTTPGTGPKWESKALAIHKDDWLRVIRNAMK
ncbi:MAG: minor capsid protein [Metasolibacillus sp.]|nr:minor capsid protein [Metasolibacillus sp.]MCT6925311.1 minor capsid protein [Metasolibacillus sp.]MCT6941459.1 minor capsid protein [Metasolibacillus sp.]